MYTDVRGVALHVIEQQYSSREAIREDDIRGHDVQ